MNQTTKAVSDVELPILRLGRDELPQVFDSNRRVSLVDDLKDESGAAATVFQRMNETGDMLRAATSVLTADGQRAIGTFIPSTGANGAANPVIATVLAGNTYGGIATVVDKPYVVAYKPLRDANNSIIGMLFTGLPQESSTAMRNAVQQAKVGSTGYVSIISASAERSGQIVMSGGGIPDKANLLEMKDDKGNAFVEGILKGAKDLKSGDTSQAAYAYKPSGAKRFVAMRTTYAYYAPWQWVIASSLPMSEVNATANIAKDARNSMVFMLALLAILIAAGACVVAWLFGCRLASQLRRSDVGVTESVVAIRTVNDDVYEAVTSTQSEAARLLHNGDVIRESVHTAVSSVTELQASISEIAKNAVNVSGDASRAVELTTKANETVDALDASSRHLKELVSGSVGSSKNPSGTWHTTNR